MHDLSFRLRLFSSMYARHFETLLEQEIAKQGFKDYCRRPGVLVAHGMIVPTIVAVWKSARAASRPHPHAASVRPLALLLMRRAAARPRDERVGAAMACTSAEDLPG
jgi:hypothetical protein